MKKKGMTIIEAVVTIALLGVIFLLVTPLIRGFGSVNNRVKTQKEIDREFANVNEFIQEKIRSAKDISGSGQYAEVFDSSGNSTSKDGVELRLQIPIEGSATPDSVSFIFEKDDITDLNGFLKYKQNSGSKEILMENVADATFRYQEGIILYYIDLDIGEYEGKLRSSFKGSASTRIDIN